MFDYAGRQRRLAERMEAEDVDVLFLAPSADLEYLTGIERQVPNFGEASYANGWVAGAFLIPDADPVFVFPRMPTPCSRRVGHGGRRRRQGLTIVPRRATALLL